MTRASLLSFYLQNRFEYVWSSFCYNALLMRMAQSNTGQFPLNYETDMKINKLSTLHTISFTNPCLDPSWDGDCCIYFTLETSGAETFVTDLTLFIWTLGWKLIRWSVLGHPDRLDASDPAHPMLQDLAYCWDSVACVHGMLQFCASPVSVMNVCRTFHRMSRICRPFCHAHQYEYLVSGIFLDVERGAIPPMFTDMEVAAQYVYSN